ncbi:MAG TPA: GAF domain-containing SpoIIE family protein phosphatase [Bacteroidota bacterium]
MGSIILILAVFIIDVIRKAVDVESSGLGVLRDVFLLLGFVLLLILLEQSTRGKRFPPLRILGLLLIASGIVVILSAVLATGVSDNFDIKGNDLLPLGFDALFVAFLLGLTLGLFTTVLMRGLRELVLFKRRKHSRRNLIAFFVILTATGIVAFWLKPLEENTLMSVLFFCTLGLAVMNSFRLSWIIYLTKREKVITLIYSFFLFLSFVILNVLLNNNTLISHSLLYFSDILAKIIVLSCLFGNMYFGMTFVSTLFHLPTAEAFDRKTTEVTSLHNLGRLVTQVFDFHDLVETVTTMTLQICEGGSTWLELIHSESVGTQPDAKAYIAEVVATKNISLEEIDKIMLPAGDVRDDVIKARELLSIDDVEQDRRFAHVKKSGVHIGSLVAAPLVSRNGLIGILYATKKMSFGFFKDDVDVITAFADQASIAIENSRLIKKSIERERLMREMTLAQEMQKKLLPQELPRVHGIDVDAISTPAFEVGGDYYDFVQLDDRRLGIVVGDVSGKGVSAAFYMSEVKGIFQAISRLHTSPREFIIHANEALSSSIDKHSFVSLIYAVIDTTSGLLTLSRAGHCPMLHISKNEVRYLRPGGMGLGMSRGSVFADAMKEESVTLSPGDVCIFYTDGVTEARCGDDEYGYDRLLERGKAAAEKSASQIKEEVLEEIKSYTGDHPNHDDLTLLVVKWMGPNAAAQKAPL